MNKIGIIGAMDEEVAELKRDMEVKSTTTMASMEFLEGTILGKDVVIVRSGIGKVNAAVCAEILAGIFHVDALINTGIAGSLNAKIDIGDIVISSDVLHHDMDATGFGYPVGQIPRMDVLSFTADDTLIQLAKKVCEQVNPEIHTHTGRIVSGDQFISDKSVKEKIIANFEGYCTEMEGAAIAQTAYLNQIPFVILRAISDKADDSATVDYPAFEKKAIEHSVNLVKGMLEKL
ncbi:MAG: 5'-methylthioadenosine/adenosylhomocysteine nucleosidase [Lachnospiraceae bacterium]|nr:5'-methylthioadenosine/adenosylhomocysteine nucleosidase [Lachnospiraceae bacterium]